ncbi:hypothetical protein PINS_up007722 [Pythium insidiosum]|nr:hypothetical protein PINS_up007722 [Pythium insidiosum]
MANTYTEILAQSEQRWVAERTNIMTTIESQCSNTSNRCARYHYAIPMAMRAERGLEIPVYLQLQLIRKERWKASDVISAKNGNDPPQVEGDCIIQDVS